MPGPGPLPAGGARPGKPGNAGPVGRHHLHGYYVGMLALNQPVRPLPLVRLVAGMFQVNARALDLLCKAFVVYLVVGGLVQVVLSWRRAGAQAFLKRWQQAREQPAPPPEAVRYFKIHCPGCEGKTAFSARWAGQTIACPHCGSPLALPQPPPDAPR